MPVEGQALALMHMMAEKNLIRVSEDPNLEESKGEVLISSRASDKEVVLFINSGSRGHISEKFTPAANHGIATEFAAMPLDKDKDTDQGRTIEEEVGTPHVPDKDKDTDQGRHEEVAPDDHTLTRDLDSDQGRR